MTRKVGDPGKVFNLSRATRAVNMLPDKKKLKKYDEYIAKYKTMAWVSLLLGAGLVAVAIWLWQSNHGIISVLTGIISLFPFWMAYTTSSAASGAAYESGLLVPAIIVNTQPVEILTLADMRSGSSSPNGPVWGCRRLRLKALPMHNLQPGERVPCAAFFGSSTDGIYAHYEPRPLCWATDDTHQIEAAVQEITREEWEILDILKEKVAAVTPDDVVYFNGNLSPREEGQNG